MILRNLSSPTSVLRTTIRRKQKNLKSVFSYSTTSVVSSSSSSGSTTLNDFFNPTEEHVQLRSMLRDFVQKEVSAVLKFDILTQLCCLNFFSKLEYHKH